MEPFLPLAVQINLLFEGVQHPDGRPYTLQEVSNATGVSIGSISQIRSGRLQNPQLSTLRAITRFFRVPLRYLETRTIDECYALMHNSTPAEPLQVHINEIAFRASSLSPKSQRDILTIIKWIEAAEELRKSGHDLPPLPNLEDVDTEEGDSAP